MALAAPGAGCSTSYQIGVAKEDEKPLYTGSAGPATNTPREQAASDQLKLPPEADLAYAKIAASEVLTKGGKDSSVPWENPRSGARGTITPLASAYSLEGSLCRDFLASYVTKAEESWMQGEACRVSEGKWEVRRLKPWRKT